MVNFISVILHKSKKEKVRQSVIDNFVTAFNKRIKKGEDCPIYLNTGENDGIQILNDIEFEKCVELAHRWGWILTRANDNYQSVTYTLDKL